MHIPKYQSRHQARLRAKRNKSDDAVKLVGLSSLDFCNKNKHSRLAIQGCILKLLEARQTRGRTLDLVRSQ
jgi:hypothetical protein